MKPFIKKNRAALIVLGVSLLLVIVMLFLPVVKLSSALYQKKSGNTFPGDERYQAAMEEVASQKTLFEDMGIEVELQESQLLRETSKGTTSLMTFSLVSSLSYTPLTLMQKGMTPGILLIIIFALLLAAFVLCMLGVNRGLAVEHRSLSKGKKALRMIACVLVLFALILIPFFAMSSTYTYHRAPTMYQNDIDVLSIGENLSAWGKLLGSTDEETTHLLLMGLDGILLPTWWLMLLPAVLMLLSCIQLAMGRLGKALSRGFLYLFVVLICIVILYPFFVMFVTAFRTPADSTDMNFTSILPSKWIWSNMKDIIDRNVLVYLKNSVLLSTGATIIAMLCGIPAAYAISRMKFKGSKAFLGFIIMSQMFSPVVLLVGISKLMNTLNLNNSILGLIFINAAFNQAFAIWLLRGVFSSISSEMEQAACIDGCSTVGALIRILLPMSAPGIVTALIFVFINAWNEYTISTVLITDAKNKPITVGITTFSSYNMIQWQYLFAAALLATIPVIILFLCIEKHLVSGLTSGGVKG